MTGIPERKRSHLSVTIELDPVPGWGHQAEDHQEYLQALLNKMLAHYHPTVEIIQHTCADGLDCDEAGVACANDLPRQRTSA